MGQSKDQKIYWPVVAFLIVQTIISSTLFWVLGLAAVGYYIFFVNGGKLMLPFSEYKLLIVFLLWGTLLGAVLLVKGSVSTVDLFRDIFYYTNPIIFLYLGSIYAKKRISLYSLFNGFILASGLLSLTSLVEVMSDFYALTSAVTVQGWRSVTGDGGVVTAISLAIIFSRIIPKENRIPRFLGITLTAVNTFYFFLTLSRTNIMILAIMYAVLLLEKENLRIIICRILGAIALVFMGLVVINYILPSNISIAFTEKMLSSLTEISLSNSWNSDFEIQSNWRGYETYCAINKWKSSGLFSQLFGYGFGERIYVGKYAHTFLRQVDGSGRALDSVAVLHNGYSTMLVKLGILGVICYLFFYLALIGKAWRARKANGLDGRILLSMGLIFLLQTYFLNGIFKDYCFFPMIILTGYSAYNIQWKNAISILSHYKEIS